MYDVGDMILYGNMGVCEVVEISLQQLNGAEPQSYYTLKPLFAEYTIYSPVENSKVFMRPVINKEQAEALIDAIPTIESEVYHNKISNQLVEHYESSLRSHNCTDLIALTKSIYAKRQELSEQKRKFGSVDERFMKRAEDLLFGEFSVALGIEREDVPGYIATRLGAAMTD